MIRQGRGAPFMRSMSGVFFLLPRFYLWEVPTEVPGGEPHLILIFIEGSRTSKSTARLAVPQGKEGSLCIVRRNIGTCNHARAATGGAPTAVRGKQAPPLQRELIS